MSVCYELVLTSDDDSWLVTAPAFPEVATFGETQQDALSHGLNAIEEAIAARIAHKDAIPSPLRETTGKGWFVELPWLVLFKTTLYMLCRARGITVAELARLMGVNHREQVDRLFRLDHNSRIDQLEAAFRAIGVPLDFTFPDDVAA